MVSCLGVTITFILPCALLPMEGGEVWRRGVQHHWCCLTGELEDGVFKSYGDHKKDNGNAYVIVISIVLFMITIAHDYDDDEADVDECPPQDSPCPG